MLKYIIIFFLISCAHIKGPERNSVTLKPSWIKNHDPQYETGNLPISLHSPLIQDGLVFGGHNDGKMKAYEVSNGRLVWEAEDNSTYHSGITHYNDQIIYGTTKGRVYSRHYLTGNLKYAIDLDGSIESISRLDKGRILFHTRNHKIFCLDPETGKILWAYKRSVPFSTTLQKASTPVIFGNNVFVGFADGFIVALTLDEGVVLWEKKLATGSKFIDVDTTAFFNQNELLISSIAGDLYGLNPSTGTVIRRLDYSMTRKPISFNDFIFIVTTSGELVKFSKTLNELNKIRLSDTALGSFSIFKNKIVISSLDGKLYVVDPQTLNVVETKHLGHSFSTVYGEMSTKEDHLALITSRNRLYLFH